MMIHKLCSLLTLLLVLLVPSCNSYTQEPRQLSTPIETSGIKIGDIVQSGQYEERAESEVFPQNNCDNKSPVIFTVRRERTLEQSVELVVDGELGGEIGAEMVGKVIASIGVEYGQSNQKSIVDSGGMEFTIEPGDFPSYTIVWREKWEKGYIIVQLDGNDIKVPYSYLTNARPELVNVVYTDCPASSTESKQEQPQEVIIPSPSPDDSSDSSNIANDDFLTPYQALHSGETRSIPAGTFVLGDIIIDGIVQYDTDGAGEGTIAYLEREAIITAEWGASCFQGNISLADELIQGEFQHGCGSVCSSVRFVIVESDGNQRVEYITK